MTYIDNWKDRYYNHLGEDVTHSRSRYYTLSGTGGGSRIDPANVSNLQTVRLARNNILPAGRYNLNVGFYADAGYLIGQGVDQTTISIIVTSQSYGCSIKDATITRIGGVLFIIAPLILSNCKILTDISAQRLDIRNSLISADFAIRQLVISSSILGLNLLKKNDFFQNWNLFDNCTLNISEKELSNTRVQLGFNNCTFKIGSFEGKLEGTDEDSYRASFIEKCNHKDGLGLDLTENDLKYWVFANDSAVQGIVIKDSIIDSFQQRNNITIGYKTADVQPIGITTSKTARNSLDASTISHTNLMKFKNDSISLDPSFSLTDKNEVSITSKAIRLEGQKKLTEINVLDTLLSGYGINITADDSLVKAVKNGEIVAGKKYLVRSTNKESATLKYDNKQYSTSLATRNNVFEGLAGMLSYEVVSGSPQIHEVASHELYQTLEMRIVDEIPSTKYSSGSLAVGHWYIVEPNTSGIDGSIKYGNDTYPLYSSFLATNASTVLSAANNAHVKRCFPENSPVHANTGKQQPIWFKIVGDDLRCMLKNNSIYEAEMQYDSETKTYIASGHPKFYNKISGDTGFNLPAFPIKGKCFQLRLRISSTNAM